MMVHAVPYANIESMRKEALEQHHCRHGPACTACGLGFFKHSTILLIPFHGCLHLGTGATSVPFHVLIF